MGGYVIIFRKMRRCKESDKTAIPGSTNPDHIAENYDIFDFSLSKEEMRRIEALDRQQRYEH